nr:hypothetical protein GCM10020093_032040 [Planobispora longispora]
MTGAPRRLASGRVRKYGGKLPRLPSSAATKASPSGTCSSGLAAFSAPMVEVRCAPGGAEQNEPAPWVGHNAVSSGSSARRRSERYWARASASVCSAPDRSVRAAEPTIKDPPEKTPSGRGPSSSTKARCSPV